MCGCVHVLLACLPRKLTMKMPMAMMMLTMKIVVSRLTIFSTSFSVSSSLVSGSLHTVSSVLLHTHTHTTGENGTRCRQEGRDEGVMGALHSPILLDSLVEHQGPY